MKKIILACAVFVTLIYSCSGTKKTSKSNTGPNTNSLNATADSIKINRSKQ